MRVAFLSSTRFGAHCLEQVLGLHGFELAGIVTAQENFRVSYSPTPVHNVQFANFVEVARETQCALVIVNESMREAHVQAALSDWDADVAFVVGWHHIVPGALLDLTPMYGIHASLLPDYRGGAPLVWAMIEGAQRTGVTLFKLDHGVDSGPIVSQRVLDIGPRDHIRHILERATLLAGEMLADAWPSFRDGSVSLVPQGSSRIGPRPQRHPESGRIDWQWSAERLDRFIRAQSEPYPGAFTDVAGHRVTIWDCDTLSVNLGPQTGLLTQEPYGPVFQCGAGCLVPTRVWIDGEEAPTVGLSDLVDSDA